MLMLILHIIINMFYIIKIYNNAGRKPRRKLSTLNSIIFSVRHPAYFTFSSSSFFRYSTAILFCSARVREKTDVPLISGLAQKYR